MKLLTVEDLKAHALTIPAGSILALKTETLLSEEEAERLGAEIRGACKGVPVIVLERLTPAVVNPETGDVFITGRAELLEALRVLLDVESIGDKVYAVREHAAGSGDGFAGNSWRHPRVLAYSAAVEMLDKLRAALLSPQP